ncbi:hypothetical protein EF918_20645 [Streptomyces sp. WAC06614]|nr:hypothetical protein EF918_20645 [Streptomyces sp. WAC06614]
MEGVGQVPQLVVGRRGEGLAARFEGLATDLVAQLGDLRHLAELLQPSGQQLARLEPESAAGEVRRQGQGHAALLGPAQEVAARDGGRQGDLARVLHQPGPFERHWYLQGLLSLTKVMRHMPRKFLFEGVVPASAGETQRSMEIWFEGSR